MEPKGTIAFATVGRPYYGFDVFSINLRSNPPSSTLTPAAEQCLTDGSSINFNAHFADEDGTLVYVSERTGSPQIHLNRPGFPGPDRHFSVPGSLFHDRPSLKNGRLYFVSAHEPADQPFKSWPAVYSVDVGGGGDVAPRRLTPAGVVDYSPAVSCGGELIAVASYGSRVWGGEFHELETEIVVFRESDPDKRVRLCERGGWPAWSGDSTVYFHRRADDGWWSIFRVDLGTDFFDRVASDGVLDLDPPRRVTAPGFHAFTPAAFHDDTSRIAVATRRRESEFRHIEIHDLESTRVYPVSRSINPNIHHYNPFVSPESGFLGYHRFRGESAPGESTTPHIQPVMSPVESLRLLRINGWFPTFSPGGDLIAVNHDFAENSGIKIVKSDGSKRWNVLSTVPTTAFYNSWSPTEKNVIYTSIGPIFQSARSTVQVARVSFDLSNLDPDREEIPADVKILTREDSGNNAFPACSPDGKSLVFRSGRSGHKNLYIIDAVNGELEGGSIRQLTEGPWIDTMPCWSPDGQLIAFSSNRHCPENPEVFGIYLVGPDGSGLRRVHVAGPEGSAASMRERINHVSFSPDGQWLVFAANIAGITAEPVALPHQFQPYGDIHVARVDGSGLRRLTRDGYENGTPTWVPGGEDVAAGACPDGDKLKGQFVEPMWITCDL